jgi:uncharacterized coiled-coil DUF342 family protein
MREQVAARLLFIKNLETRYKTLTKQINEYKNKIKELFDSPDELFNIYKQYVLPYF